MTLQSQIRPECLALPERQQNIKVIKDYFGGEGEVDEAEAAQEMQEHRRAETKKKRTSTGLANGVLSGGEEIAKGQAKEIRDFWKAQGYAVSAWPARDGHDERGNPVWAVRTSLKNGLPKNYRGPRA